MNRSISSEFDENRSISKQKVPRAAQAPFDANASTQSSRPQTMQGGGRSSSSTAGTGAEMKRVGTAPNTGKGRSRTYSSANIERDYPGIHVNKKFDVHEYNANI